MSNARAARGTLIKYGDGGAPEVFTTVAEIRGTIKFDGMEAEEIEVTTHNSAALNKFKEYITGLIEPGNVEFEINYLSDNATHQALRTKFLAQEIGNWQLVQAGGAETITFAAYVQRLPIEYSVDDAVMASITLRITGAVTFA